jgi:hypothetical protein
MLGANRVLSGPNDAIDTTQDGQWENDIRVLATSEAVTDQVSNTPNE